MTKPIIETKFTRLPKAELHVHLRNSMSTQLTERLAQKNGVELPEERLDGNEFVWTDFADMLKIHDLTRPVMQTQDDYMEAAYNYLTWSSYKGMIYGELMISYSPEETSGISYRDQVDGVAAGISKAREETGIEGRMILSGIRHRGPEVVEEMAKQALHYSHPMVTGWGLAGDEVNFGPKPFERAFAIAKEAGLRSTIHAGEWRGPESIRAALALPGVERLGHGFRIMEDDSLVDEVVDKGITLELCPGSSVRLGLFNSYDEYPYKQLYDRGVKLTLNTDDPPYFSTSISREYRRMAEAHNFSREHMLGITRNAINAAFVDAETRAVLLKKVV